VIADTNTYLLVGLKDSANERVWAEFCARYRPVLLSFARRLGLTEDDAQDAAQETLQAFADGYPPGQYARDKGGLRNWLYGIARNQIHLLRRRDERQRAATEAEIEPAIGGESRGRRNSHRLGNSGAGG
jgi:DNA-directed RNA polymerase specialized sigma24 family protein